MSTDSAILPVRRLILLHGLASTPKEFSLLLHPLRRLGLQLECPTVPGYSHGMLATRARWTDWVDAATESVSKLLADDGEPALLGGLCSGAMLALAAAGRLPRAPLRGLVLLSPLIAYNGWGLPWWYRLRYLAYGLGIAPWFSMSEREPYGLKNERMRQWVRAQMEGEEATLVGPASVPLNIVRESEGLSRHARRLLSEQQRPLLMVHAREDEICRLDTVRKTVGGLRPGIASLEVLENSYHMVSADNDRQRVGELIAGFAARLRPGVHPGSASFPHSPRAAGALARIS
ncbi:alpha/beta fold hydrolase [Paucibacter sp. R3-3]|uniref:Alpha/beta fold hydrolase n=1 Tax=Roseateles agri TaxID=3098619 RepID=A0ABU5DHR4_9BURK|nr:alpha/beta fold hydrolase [Paucibacter sp. R3-3]MDY0745817.1 alpha/beta fold hydrolase [Paucibacter sp. R3-3]